MIRELRMDFKALPLVRMCQLLNVPRSLVYRKPNERPERAAFYQNLGFEIARILGLHPGYGYRRVRLELAKSSVACGYKSVARVMREEGLQVRSRKRRPQTSDGKGAGTYPNLLKTAIIDGPGQAWVADITYIGLPHGFAYLACVLDVFLRKVVGSATSLRIDANLTLSALHDALSKFQPPKNWIHHSDRGSQYFSGRYIQTVLEAGGRISCSDKACPQDNAFMESFFKTLKAEEVWLEDYENLSQANESISGFIRYYNSDRMHSSLNYMSPEEFEASLKETDPS
jgi:putative transposase